jgi:predicted heme/steroid binding protein
MTELKVLCAKIYLAALVTFGALLLLPGLSSGTEEYAQKTGQSCEVCHVDPFGGGELTAAGKAYQNSIHPAKTSSESGTAQRLFRLAVGFLHIVTGFFWFGTILYIHLVLKPKYAAQGLPKGEMLIGLVSMAIMAVTGSILTLYRISSLDMLFHSRFGTLLVIKIAIFLVMVIAALSVVLLIAPRLRRKKRQPAPVVKDELTVTELSRFDGKDGRPAYFAYDGQVFDATESKLWKKGLHMGRHNAGEDLTDALKLAPHGSDKIMGMPVAARIVQGDESTGMTLPQKIFYILAYLNLTAVAGILLILALWRWW